MIESSEFSRKLNVWAIDCILYEVATTGKRAFRDYFETLSFTNGVEKDGVQLDRNQNPSFRKDTFSSQKQCKIFVLDQINSILHVRLAPESSKRATMMGLKVRFEEIKAYLVNETLDSGIVIQELEVVVRRYVFPRRPWSPYGTKIKLENYIVSDK